MISTNPGTTESGGCKATAVVTVTAADKVDAFMSLRDLPCPTDRVTAGLDEGTTTTSEARGPTTIGGGGVVTTSSTTGFDVKESIASKTGMLRAAWVSLFAVLGAFYMCLARV